MSEVTVTVSLANKDAVMETNTAGAGHTSSLIIGDADGFVIHKARIR